MWLIVGWVINAASLLLLAWLMPAVTVAASSCANTVGSARSLVRFVPARGPSSCVSSTSCHAPASSSTLVATGTTCSAKRPAARAASAFSWLASAKRSCCSRVMP